MIPFMMGFLRATAAPLLIAALLPHASGCVTGGGSTGGPTAGSTLRSSRRPAKAIKTPKDIAALARAAAQRHHVDPTLVLGVIHVESRFNPRARSHVGARGLMQLMPGTAASLAKRLQWPDADPTDPAFNVEAGTYYLAYLLRRFDGDESLALAAYNTGPARVKRWQKRGRSLPAYSRRYVAAVQRARARFGVGAAPKVEPEEHDRAGLRRLLRQQLYGERPDEPLAQDDARAPAAGGAS